MTTGQPVRIGVIGGAFGIQHLQGYGATKNAEVVASCPTRGRDVYQRMDPRSSMVCSGG